MDKRGTQASCTAGERPAPPHGARVLYLSYDGMCDPLGGSQVLPYLFGLAKRGHSVSLISFEKAGRTDSDLAEVRQACASAGIPWYPLTYHKWPPVLSSIYDLALMRHRAFRLHRKEHFFVVHARSYLPGLVGLSMKRRLGLRFIFDMRGFWADERLEGGAWNMAKPLYRMIYAFFKRREREFWDEADRLVSLTEEARREIILQDSGAAPIEVIPCCVDLELFRPADDRTRDSARSLLGIRKADRVLGYVGSLGGNYMLDEMLDFYRSYRKHYGAAKFLFVTHTPEALIRSAAARKKLPAHEIMIKAARRSEVPMVMAAANEGIAFKQATFSAKACSPTKLGEMLALEIPVVTNGGIGDVDRIITESGSGVIIERFDDAAYCAALKQLDRLVPDKRRWRSATRRWLNLESGVEKYDALYQSLVTPLNQDIPHISPRDIR